jgi:nucleotide-binding universal stress UspA family protein
MKEKMFRKVLFPTDFSAVSRKALEYVKELKELGTEEIVLLNVIKNQYYYLSEDSFLKDLEGPVEELKKEVKEKLIPIAYELQERGFKVKAVIAGGVPFSKILEVAQKEKVSSIVLGSQGKGILKKIFLGSVSEAVVRGSKHPVFVIKNDSPVIEGQKELPETEDRVPWRIFNRIKLNSQARV